VWQERKDYGLGNAEQECQQLTGDQLLLCVRGLCLGGGRRLRVGRAAATCKLRQSALLELGRSNGREAENSPSERRLHKWTLVSALVSPAPLSLTLNKRHSFYVFV
jgi:hypothetical protein